MMVIPYSVGKVRNHALPTLYEIAIIIVMNDAAELGVLSGKVLAAECELRLIRLKLEQIISGVGLLATGLPQRVGSIEQSFHGLAGELASGLGQNQQVRTRHDARFDALDAGLTALRTEWGDSMAKLLAAFQSPR